MEYQVGDLDMKKVRQYLCNLFEEAFNRGENVISYCAIVFNGNDEDLLNLINNSNIDVEQFRIKGPKGAKK